jgi:GT2 family glycosyltransferase
LALRIDDTGLIEGREAEPAAWPSVSIVFLVYNRCDELRESLCRMLSSDYDPERLEVIVVDNASTDGSSAMVASEFPEVHLIVRSKNVGVSGFNDGFAAARCDYVLALDDDCYMQKDGLRRAITAAEAANADLVSFGISSASDPGFRFDLGYRTGLLSFWGCAVLVRREVLERLGGYDPDIFVWANELEFMLRFFDHGFRHLHIPELVAVHMKEADEVWADYVATPGYRFNARHFAYIAGKLLRPRDAFEALVARLAVHLREGFRVNPAALKAIPHCLSGFLHGLRRRQPVTNAEVSRVYRRNFESFASPWWVSRPLVEFIRPRGDPGRRRADYFASRVRYYPNAADTLEF